MGYREKDSLLVFTLSLRMVISPVKWPIMQVGSFLSSPQQQSKAEMGRLHSISQCLNCFSSSSKSPFFSSNFALSTINFLTSLSSIVNNFPLIVPNTRYFLTLSIFMQVMGVAASNFNLNSLSVARIMIPSLPYEPTKRKLSNAKRLWITSPQLITFLGLQCLTLTGGLWSVTSMVLAVSVSISVSFFLVLVMSSLPLLRPFLAFLSRPGRSRLNSLFICTPLTVDMERKLCLLSQPSGALMSPFLMAKLSRQRKSGLSCSSVLIISDTRPQQSALYLGLQSSVFFSISVFSLHSSIMYSQSVLPKEQTSSLKLWPGTMTLLSLNLTINLGDTYSIVPATFCVLQALSLMANPKSPTLYSNLLQAFLTSRMLSGLISRCMYPLRCIFAKKGIIADRNSLSSALLKQSFFRLRVRISSARVEEQSSMMMPSSNLPVRLFSRVQQQTSCMGGRFTLTMRSSSMHLMVSTSLKAMLSSSNEANSMHLWAQLWWSSRCRTWFTTAQLPLPSRFSILKSRSKL